MSSSNHDNVSPPRVDIDKFWAVVIGIDNYANPKERNLRGCVSDATRIFQYLNEKMGVDASHIQLLLSTTPQSYNHTPDAEHSAPTRDNIINTLIGLSTKNAIKENDNILIFFSGHGAIYNCEDYYNTYPASMGTIEALCPKDRDPENGISDISDREMSTILAEICRTKGHHITVILDCCHSSGVTRDVVVGRSKGLVRKARVPDELEPGVVIGAMLTAADKTLEQFRTGNRPRYGSVTKGDWQPQSKKTHVLLAACDSYDFANESSEPDVAYLGPVRYGAFTRALLEKLEKIDWEEGDEDLPTYVNLIDDLTPIEHWHFTQYPCASGDHRHQRLWYTGRRDCCTVLGI